MIKKYCCLSQFSPDLDNRVENYIQINKYQDRSIISWTHSQKYLAAYPKKFYFWSGRHFSSGENERVWNEKLFFVIRIKYIRSRYPIACGLTCSAGKHGWTRGTFDSTGLKQKIFYQYSSFFLIFKIFNDEILQMF